MNLICRGDDGSERPVSREQHWLNLWSFARFDARLTYAEFYAPTPRKLKALLRCKEQHWIETGAAVVPQNTCA